MIYWIFFSFHLVIFPFRSKQGTDNIVLELCDEIQSKLPFSIETLKPLTTKIATRFFKEKTLKNFLQKNFHTNSSYITPDKMISKESIFKKYFLILSFNGM